MQTASVSQLKLSLSAYLRKVKAGEEVVITERGRPIARLLPLAYSFTGWYGPTVTIGTSGSEPHRGCRD